MDQFRDGMRDGVPIGLGYFAVAFSLGIAARNAGLSALQGFVTSILCVASAGEYACFSLIAAGATYAEMAVMSAVANARYFLMSCAFSQRFSPKTGMGHRLLMGYGITDELFGIAIARPGHLKPAYSYGAMLTSIPLWAIGTALGVIAGNVLSARLVSALSVALYGMFLAIIIPPAKRDRVILVFVALSFALSWACGLLPGVSSLSPGTRTILLTVLLSAAAAHFFPVKEEVLEEEDKDEK
jgi:predicted branched-subunit amino acid permease